MSADYLVIGHFHYVDDTKSAIVKMRETEFGRIELYSPAPSHELEEEIHRGMPRSPIRFYTFFGGLTGCLGGFLMTIWMSIDYPLRASAKPLISIPAFVVIAFECTILLGAILTLLGLLWHCRIPNLCYKPGYRPNFTEDTFGLVVSVAAKEEVDKVKAELESCGAEKVEVQYVR